MTLNEEEEIVDIGLLVDSAIENAILRYEQDLKETSIMAEPPQSSNEYFDVPAKDNDDLDSIDLYVRKRVLEANEELRREEITDGPSQPQERRSSKVHFADEVSASDIESAAELIEEELSSISNKAEVDISDSNSVRGSEDSSLPAKDTCVETIPCTPEKKQLKRPVTSVPSKTSEDIAKARDAWLRKKLIQIRKEKERARILAEQTEQNRIRREKELEEIRQTNWRDWLEKKRKKDRLRNQGEEIRQYYLDKERMHTREECDKAFKKWVKGKERQYFKKKEEDEYMMNITIAIMRQLKRSKTISEAIRTASKETHSFIQYKVLKL